MGLFTLKSLLFFGILKLGFKILHLEQENGRRTGYLVS